MVSWCGSWKVINGNEFSKYNYHSLEYSTTRLAGYDLLLYDDNVCIKTWIELDNLGKFLEYEN